MVAIENFDPLKAYAQQTLVAFLKSQRWQTQAPISENPVDSKLIIG